MSRLLGKHLNFPGGLSPREESTLLSCVCDVLPSSCVYQLYLIGSLSRNEATFSYFNGEYKPLSDIEMYLLSENKLSSTYWNMIRRMLSTHLPDWSIDISGTTFKKFHKFKTRQWLIDVGNTGRLLIHSNMHDKHAFSKFRDITPSAIDNVTILSNRIIENKNETCNQYYFNIKLCIDMVGVVIACENRYRTKYSERFDALLNVHDLFGVTYNIPAYLMNEFVEAARQAFCIKLEEHNNSDEELYNFSLKHKNCLREFMVYLLPICLYKISSKKYIIYNDPIRAYKMYLSRSSFFIHKLRWILQVWRNPSIVSMMFYCGKLNMLPSEFVYYQGIKSYFMNKCDIPIKALFPLWEKYCKST